MPFSLSKSEVRKILIAFKYHPLWRIKFVMLLINDLQKRTIMEPIRQYHIENPNDPEEKRRTLCFLPLDNSWQTNEALFVDINLTVREAIEDKDQIDLHEKCEICWRSEDDLILLLLAHVTSE